MSRILAILALFLFVLPGQTNAQTHKVKQTAKADKSSPTAAPVVPLQADSPPDKRGTSESPFVVNTRPIQSDEEAAEEARKDAEQKRFNRWTIDLTIAIAVCAFLQFLAIVGQIVVYRGQSKLMANTLGEIHTQAEQMKIQTSTAQIAAGTALEQLRVMQIQTDATQAKEQAQISVTLSNIEIFLIANTQFPFSRLHLVLENIGETRAYNLSGKYEAAAWEKDAAPPSQQMLDLALPQFIRPGTPAESASIEIRPAFGSSDIPSVFYIHIRGCIMYNDIFQPNRTRHTTFQYRCQFRVRTNSNALARTVEWEAYGPDNHSS